MRFSGPILTPTPGGFLMICMFCWAGGDGVGPMSTPALSRRFRVVPPEALDPKGFGFRVEGL